MKSLPGYTTATSVPTLLPGAGLLEVLRREEGGGQRKRRAGRREG